MGLLLCKCCCSCKNSNRNSVGVLADKPIKVLLLGLEGSGKTEVAHMLTKVKRTDFESTNGSKYYSTRMAIESDEWQSMGITEIGGSKDMQRIWHHYYAGSMAFIYCYDMSSSYELLCETFQLLDKVLSHAFVRGKSILLIGTKSDLVDEGLQLYDIENTFQLGALAVKYACSFRMCYSEKSSKGKDSNQSLTNGIKWLIKSVLNNYNELEVRIKGDTNMKTWQDQTEKLIAAGKMKRWRYTRFPQRAPKRRKYKKIWKYVGPQAETFYIRPHTAPSVFTISQFSRQASVETIDTNIIVPNELEDRTQNLEEFETGSKQVTHV